MVFWQTLPELQAQLSQLSLTTLAHAECLRLLSNYLSFALQHFIECIPTLISYWIEPLSAEDDDGVIADLLCFDDIKLCQGILGYLPLWTPMGVFSGCIRNFTEQRKPFNALGSMILLFADLENVAEPTAEDWLTLISEAEQLPEKARDRVIPWLRSQFKRCSQRIAAKPKYMTTTSERISRFNVTKYLAEYSGLDCVKSWIAQTPEKEQEAAAAFLATGSGEELIPKYATWEGPSNPTQSACIGASMERTKHKDTDCRMLSCVCFPNDEDDEWEESLDWFTGECEVCLVEIARFCYAMRLPLNKGGWIGCVCGIECLKALAESERLLDPGNTDEFLRIDTLEAELESSKILDRISLASPELVAEEVNYQEVQASEEYYQLKYRC